MFTGVSLMLVRYRLECMGFGPESVWRLHQLTDFVSDEYEAVQEAAVGVRGIL